MALSMVAVLVIGSLAGAAQTEGYTVAIEPLKSLGSDQEIVDRLEAILRQEVSRLRGVSYKQCPTAADRCGDDVACLAGRGGSCGVKKMVFGTVATLGRSYVLDLKLIDVRSRAEERRHTQPLAGDQSVLIEGVRVAVTRLIVPEQYLGALEVRFEQPGAKVFVDGVDAGTTPLGAIQNLTPGPHELRVVLAGAQDFTRSVEVSFGRTTLVNLSLKGTIFDASIETPATAVVEPANQAAPPTRRGTSPWLASGIAAAATSAVALVASGICFGVYGYNWSEMEGMTDKARRTDGTEITVVKYERAPDYNQAYDQMYAAWNMGFGLAAVGAVAAIAGAGLFTWYLLRPGEE
ncbi:MAG: PEGA domain-containing protein [Deltaproteobacteria bacterium]|nr:PEGA domain-containing protein [Deltaproteobacteria bacterium]